MIYRLSEYFVHYSRLISGGFRGLGVAVAPMDVIPEFVVKFLEKLPVVPYVISCLPPKRFCPLSSSPGSGIEPNYILAVNKSLELMELVFRSLCMIF